MPPTRGGRPFSGMISRVTPARRFRLLAVLVVVGAVVFVLSAFAAWRDVRAAQNELSGVRRTLSAIVKDPALLKTKDGRAEAVRRLDDADAEVAAARRRVSRSLPLSKSVSRSTSKYCCRPATTLRLSRRRRRPLQSNPH